MSIYHLKTTKLVVKLMYGKNMKRYSIIWKVRN